MKRELTKPILGPAAANISSCIPNHEAQGQLRVRHPHVLARLAELRDEAVDIIVVEGLGTGESPDSCLESENLSLALAQTYGDPFQYSCQNGGKLVARLETKPGMEGAKNTGEGSGSFGLHTDDAALPENFRCRHIQLLGVNNDAQAATNVVRLDKLIPAVPSRVLDALQKPNYRTRLPRSFGFRHEIWSEPMPLLEQRRGLWFAAMPSYAAKPIAEDDSTTAAMAALSVFVHLAEEFIEPIIIRPGTLVAFHNGRILHGRSQFSGRRLVLRTLVRPDLNDLRSATGIDGNIFPVWPLLEEKPQPAHAACAKSCAGRCNHCSINS